jgi:serine/threonine protein phosphatase PrpC
MIYKYCAKTDTGRARDNNEDSVAIDEDTRLVVLADGMGGYNAGEVASGMATAYIKTELSRWLSEVGEVARTREVRRAMEICVDSANLAIFNAANTNSQYAGMGTTLVVGVLRDDGLVLAHIGDSRCYRLRAGKLEQITRDHSLLQEQLDAGLITPEQAEHSTIKNLVTRALGVEAVVLTEVNEHAVEVGDIYLLCSDGLSDMVNDATIAKVLLGESGLERQAQALVDTANDHGGRDNISVLLVEVGKGNEKRGLIARLLGK